jgi:hypothetical protein
MMLSVQGGPLFGGDMRSGINLGQKGTSIACPHKIMYQSVHKLIFSLSIHFEV